MRIRIMAIIGMCAALLNIGAAAAMPEDMTVGRLLNICKAPTMQAATLAGDQLGWRRLTDAETEEWRTHFVAYNGGSVEVVGWRRDKIDGAESLSFWIAVGLNGHKACAYSTKKPAEFLHALSERLGPPDTLDKEDAIEMVSAYWKRGAVEYSFTQVGSSATINIGPGQ
ncbi:hypothetical protein [Brucella cytisi]|uniref:Lipoprotein n=1 Tax=Brucella cytisi TaxID=407152 RepID=A0A1J6IBZ9_9HYPH|nr:hypothetical protein [Brucella cytisi]OIS92560.1 hypothetical protein BLA27_15355 [Brucella cytisi]